MQEGWCGDLPKLHLLFVLCFTYQQELNVLVSQSNITKSTAASIRYVTYWNFDWIRSHIFVNRFLLLVSALLFGRRTKCSLHSAQPRSLLPHFEVPEGSCNEKLEHNDGCETYIYFQYTRTQMLSDIRIQKLQICRFQIRNINRLIYQHFDIYTSEVKHEGNQLDVTTKESIGQNRISGQPWPQSASKNGQDSGRTWHLVFRTSSIRERSLSDTWIHESM